MLYSISKYLNELGFPKEESDHVSCNVVDGDDGHRHDVPDHSREGGQVHEVTGHTEEQHNHMSPSEHRVSEMIQC